MKCLESETLMNYAYRLMDGGAASKVRVHLGECARCRDIAEKYGRLDTLLDEWKVADPNPWFDARVRSAIEAQAAHHQVTPFWGREWVRSLALASLGILLIAGAFWFSRSRASNASRVAVNPSRPAMGRPAPAQSAQVRPPVMKPHTGVSPAPRVPGSTQAMNSSSEERVTQALEDYDLAANFDVLSELPKGEQRVAN